MRQIVQRLRRNAGPIAGQHTIQEWRRLWQRACPAYQMAIEKNLEVISASVAMHPATVLNSVTTLLFGLTASSLTESALPEMSPDRDSNSASPRPVTLVVLAASVPGLAAQSLLPLLAYGSAVILKPSRREPHTARLLVEVLCRLDPALTNAIAILDEIDLSSDTINAIDFDRVIVYGEDATVAQFNEQFNEQFSNQLQPGAEPGIAVSGQGHGWSLVYLGESAVDEAILDAIALDIARFDQRGCLCPHAVLTWGPAEPIVHSLGRALARVTDQLPPSASAATLGALRQIRDAAVAAGLAVSDQPLATGLVVAAAPDQAVEESPGGRCVRVHGGVGVGGLVERLRPVAGQIQSLAVAGPELVGSVVAGPDLPGSNVSGSETTSLVVASEIQAVAKELGIARLATPGAMHAPDFAWVVEQLGIGKR